ncbi:MAG: hypothetical protein ACYSUV_07800 [Planctomycetota bacterium]
MEGRQDKFSIYEWWRLPRCARNDVTIYYWRFTIYDAFGFARPFAKATEGRQDKFSIYEWG